MTENSSLLIIDAHGIYIPQLFASNYSHYIQNKDQLLEELDDISNPNNEFYWESWDTIIESAILKDDKGLICSLYQNGDLWAVPESELELIPSEF